MKTATEAMMFKALADDSRITIIKILCYGEKCANEILEKLNIGQPTLSHHMNILCNCGLVRARRDGKRTYYSMDSDGIDTLKNTIDTLTRLHIRRSNTLPEALL